MGGSTSSSAGFVCLAALATTHPEWDHVHGQEEPAMAVMES
jgi:hypothetical protein